MKLSKTQAETLVRAYTQAYDNAYVVSAARHTTAGVLIRLGLAEVKNIAPVHIATGRRCGEVLRVELTEAGIELAKELSR